MTSETMVGAHERARIQVDVYKAPDGFRWRIKSSARGRRVISESSEAYVDKRASMRGLLLTTGGDYTELFRMRAADGHTYTQGVIVRGIAGGLVEEIFVQLPRPRRGQPVTALVATTAAPEASWALVLGASAGIVMLVLVGSVFVRLLRWKP